MSITNGDIAGLQVGDVIRVTGWDDGVTIEGPVGRAQFSSSLWLGNHLCLTPAPPNRAWMDRPEARLTVVSRAPRPLYVNSDRAEPVGGDVVRDADDDSDPCVWLYADPDSVVPWICRGATHGGYDWIKHRQLPARLRLLVDGETGQVVR